MGWWRFWVTSFGPFTIALYLDLEYRLRALYLIPLMTAIYAAIFLLPWVILLAVDGFR
jgi:hypothetical protein